MGGLVSGCGCVHANVCVWGGGTVVPDGVCVCGGVCLSVSRGG